MKYYSTGEEAREIAVAKYIDRDSVLMYFYKCTNCDESDVMDDERSVVSTKHRYCSNCGTLHVLELN